MKKLLSVFTAAVISCVSFTVCGAEDITVTLDGAKIAFDVPPRIIDERTFVPMRAIFEALGAEVMWDDSTKTVTAEKDGTEIIMNIGYDMIFVNYVPVTLDAPPRIIDGRTLVPIRAVAESFECDVVWDGEAHTVTITSPVEDNPKKADDKFPIEYDISSETGSNSVGRFRITALEKQEDGNYKIEYTLQTYQDGSGKQAVVFECLDGGGNVIGTFGDLFYNDAYNWTEQTGSAVISGRTVKIRLSENNQ